MAWINQLVNQQYEEPQEPQDEGTSQDVPFNLNWGAIGQGLNQVAEYYDEPQYQQPQQQYNEPQNLNWFGDVVGGFNQAAQNYQYNEPQYNEPQLPDNLFMGVAQAFDNYQQPEQPRNYDYNDPLDVVNNFIGNAAQGQLAARNEQTGQELYTPY